MNACQYGPPRPDRPARRSRIRASIRPIASSTPHRVTGISSQPGQSMVELALVLGLVLVLLLGSLDVWQVAMSRYTVAQAARTAAFVAATRGGPDGLPLNVAIDLHTTSDLHGRVAAAARTIITRGMTTRSGQATLTIRCPQGCVRTAPVVVEIHYREPIWAPIPPFFVLDMTLQATRPLERDSS